MPVEGETFSRGPFFSGRKWRMCAPLSIRTLFCTVSASVPNDTIKEPGWFHIYVPPDDSTKKKNLSFVKRGVTP